MYVLKGLDKRLNDMEFEILNFIISDEGFGFCEEYEKKFNASFGMLEPDGIHCLST